MRHTARCTPAETTLRESKTARAWIWEVAYSDAPLFAINQMLIFVFCLLFGKGSDIQICFRLKLSLNNHTFNFRNTPIFAFANRFLLLLHRITFPITLIDIFRPSEIFVCTCTCTFVPGTFGDLLECWRGSTEWPGIRPIYPTAPRYR